MFCVSICAYCAPVSAAADCTQTCEDVYLTSVGKLCGGIRLEFKMHTHMAEAFAM